MKKHTHNKYIDTYSSFTFDGKAIRFRNDGLFTICRWQGQT